MSAAPLKIGVWLSSLRPDLFVEVAVEAERLGFESLWMSEHLILPTHREQPPGAEVAHATISAATPTFDVLGYLGHLAAHTSRIRLGTWVYLLGLRHPFVSARAAQTLDLVSGGRCDLGVGSGWLAGEWEAAELDFASRGRRLSEAIDVCRRLWSEEEIEHHGEFYSFDGVGFEPKPIQPGGPPIHVGGESPAALRRAAAVGDGWIGMQHTPESAAAMVETLHRLGAAPRPGRTEFEVTVGGPIDTADDVDRWLAAGVTRVIVSPWKRSSEALDALRDMAARLSLPAAS